MTWGGDLSSDPPRGKVNYDLLAEVFVALNVSNISAVTGTKTTTSTTITTTTITTARSATNFEGRFLESTINTTTTKIFHLSPT